MEAAVDMGVAWAAKAAPVADLEVDRAAPVDPEVGRAVKAERAVDRAAPVALEVARAVKVVPVVRVEARAARAVMEATAAVAPVVRVAPGEPAVEVALEAMVDQAAARVEQAVARTFRNR